MKILKSLFIALALIVGAGAAHADEGDNGIGITLNYGTGGHGMSNLGLGVRYDRMLSDNLRIEPHFIYYFDNDEFREKDLGVNLHYLFNMSDDKLHFYPIFGVTTIFGAELEQGKKGMDGYKEKDSFFRFGCNFGAGIQYDVTDDFSLIGECKYKLVSKYDNVNFAIGCMMTF